MIVESLPCDFFTNSQTCVPSTQHISSLLRVYFPRSSGLGHIWGWRLRDTWFAGCVTLDKSLPHSVLSSLISKMRHWNYLHLKMLKLVPWMCLWSTELSGPHPMLLSGETSLRKYVLKGTKNSSVRYYTPEGRCCIIILIFR